MRHKNYLISFLLLLSALTATAQTCPGPAVRTALINLQKSIADPTFYTAQNALAGQVPVTDTCGNLRYTRYVVISDTCICCNPITTPVVGAPPSTFTHICGTDSIFYFDWRREPIFLGEALTITQIIDSLEADTNLLYNWYTRNDTTTNLLRTAFVLRSAWWRGIDSVGFLRWSMRPDGFDGSQFTVYQDSVVVDADTIIWKSSWHPELQVHEMQAEGTYEHVDSSKSFVLGQFPNFPNFFYDGREKGFFYSPSYEGRIGFEDGNGTTGANTVVYMQGPDNDYYVFGKSEAASDNHYQQHYSVSAGKSLYESEINHSGYLDTLSIFKSFQSTLSDRDAHYVIMGESAPGVNAIGAFAYLGYSIGTNSEIDIYSPTLSFGVQQNSHAGTIIHYDWIKIELFDDDTTKNAISFYDSSYLWVNNRPSSTIGDTSFHFWAGNGIATDPGFMTLDQVCAHCSDGAVNWYNSNSTTTDNTRIADVLETATWRSDNVVQDGIVPFRFELAGGGANEPENTVWVFPNGDSCMIAQADAESIFFTNAFWLIKADAATTVQADSFQFNPNAGGTAFRVGEYNVITQNSNAAPTHKDAIEYSSITGTAQTELFLDGSAAVWGIPTNAAQNFKVHISAICSAAGNGVGISTGEAFTGWYLGGIKRVGSTTALVGTVQADATAQADTGMATSVVTIDADDGDDSLRIRFTPPSTAGSSTVIQVTATIEITQSSY